MKIQEITSKTRSIIHEVCGRTYNHAVVRINGRIHYFKEEQVRAMQIMVVRMNDAEYEDFCNSVIIYDGPTVRESTGTITILRDGRLGSAFQKGFFTTTSDLAMQLLSDLALHFKMQPILK